MGSDLEFRAKLRDRRAYPALIGAALVVVALVAINLLFPSGKAEGNRPAVLASPSPSSSPPSLTTPSSTPEVDPQMGDFTIGRHSLTVGGVPLSFRTTTAGWEPYGSLLIAKSERGPQGAEGIIFWAGVPDDPFAVPCAPLDGPPIGSVGDVAAVVSTAPGTELVSGPSGATVGGRPAGHAVVIVREDVGCDPGFLYNWKARNGGALWVRSELGDTIRVWIVDVDGKRLFIGGETREDASPRLEQEVQQIVDSIEFR